MSIIIKEVIQLKFVRLKFLCKYCNKKGHIKERHGFKNVTWVSDSIGT